MPSLAYLRAPAGASKAAGPFPHAPVDEYMAPDRIGWLMGVPDPADACEGHRLAIKAMATGERASGRLFGARATDECSGCLVCQTALELVRAIALERAMDRTLRVSRPFGRFWAQPHSRSAGLNADPAP